MTELRFDPDKAHKAQKAMFAALITASSAVERPLRNVTFPEMPASVDGATREGIANAIALMADARVAAASVASALKSRAQILGVHDKVAEMSNWWTVGDIAIGLTGGDAFYKTFGGLDITDPDWNPIEGKFGGWQHTDYSAKDQALAWGNFMLNFVGGPIIKATAKGGRRLLRLGKSTRPKKPVPAPKIADPTKPFTPQQLSDAWTHKVRMYASDSFGPMNPGPLPAKIAETFRSNTYNRVIAESDTLMYRVHGPGGELGSWWSRTPPRGSLQARLDNAVLREWGSPMNQLNVVRVPKGSLYFEGIAGPQVSKKTGESMVGGGTQVYLPYIDPAWQVRLSHAG